MKRILLFLLLAAAGVLQAQIVNIPDSNFKQVLLNTSGTSAVAKNAEGLSFAIDTNVDGEIQIAEAMAVWEINLEVVPLNIESIEGIEAFTNLRNLQIRGQRLTSLNISTLSNIVELDCSNNKLPSLNLSGLANLEVVDCSSNQGSGYRLNSINLSGTSGLKKLF